MKSKDRIRLLQISYFLAVGLLLVWPAAARAQTVVATIPVGTDIPRAVAANPVTNKIYVASCTSLTAIDGATNATTVIKGCFGDLAVNSVTDKIYFPDGVIDGTTNAVTYISGVGGTAVAVNPVTNKIYVANMAGYTYVIDGTTNSVTTVIDPNAQFLFPAAIAVNPATNKIYVANNGLPVPFNTNPGNVTVIDGATNSTTTLTDPNASTPVSVAVNSVTNKIYVANNGSSPNLNHGNITVIDGATNAMTTLTDPNAVALQSIAVNQTTNKIYVANASDNVTVIDGATNAISTVTDPNAKGTNAVAVDSATDTIYVTNFGCDSGCINPGSVTIINGATNAVTTVIDPNASNPAAVALDPATNMIYVVNYNYVAAKGSVTVIDGGATPTSHVLSVLLAGNGSGTVTSNPPGVNCGTSCAANFATGTAVSLSASAASRSTFSGWAAPCTGTAACGVPMTSDVFVVAVFDVSPPPDFGLVPASTNLTVQRGGEAADVIFIVPLVGSSFGDAIQFSCTVSGPAPMPTCALSPSTVTTGASQGSSTLTITAPGMAATLTSPTEGWRWGLLYTAVLPLTGVLLLGFGMTAGDLKPRKRQLWLLCSLFIMFVALQTGCGGGSSSQQVQPQNYIVTVTATSGALQHTALVNVTVQ